MRSLALIATLVLAISISAVQSRPNDRWAQASPERQQFFKDAVMPRFLGMENQKLTSCCGDADAYEADDFDVVDGQLFAILTCNEPSNCYLGDPREDGGGNYHSFPEGHRVPIPVIAILPPHQPENRTGHGWVFISETGVVYCYALPGGY